MSTIFLIPTVLAENAAETIPAYVLDGIKKCTVIFAENERTARRFLKMLDRTIVIDNFEWFTIGKAEEEQADQFRKKIKEDKNIAIISEAGCPGVADPGRILVGIAQKMNCKVQPFVGPSSILLALMASGMNGQQFEFTGYLPIEHMERCKKIKELELLSQKNNSTKIFIETPYRNDQLIESVLKTCDAKTMFCIAANITGENEFIKTMSIGEWKNKIPVLHKQPAIFLLYAGS